MARTKMNKQNDTKTRTTSSVLPLGKLKWASSKKNHNCFSSGKMSIHEQMSNRVVLNSNLTVSKTEPSERESEI